MKKALSFLLIVLLVVSCNRQTKKATTERIITVSIAPFKYFIDRISGGDFVVNIMVPPGSDPHIYEPVPEQINRLRSSEAYLSNGFLGFEMVWLERFYEISPGMKRLNLGEFITPISVDHTHSAEHLEGADPHYWMSPVCALKIASAVKLLLQELNPSESEKYEINFSNLASEIESIHKRAGELFAGHSSEAFMIYHPNLAYLARDYGLKEIAIEAEGKEPSPAELKELIDIAGRDSITTIFVQKEYDKRNARAIAGEIGAGLTVIDPLSEDWETSVNTIIDALYQSFNE